MTRGQELYKRHCSKRGSSHHSGKGGLMSQTRVCTELLRDRTVTGSEATLGLQSSDGGHIGVSAAVSVRAPHESPRKGSAPRTPSSEAGVPQGDFITLFPGPFTPAPTIFSRNVPGSHGLLRAVSGSLKPSSTLYPLPSLHTLAPKHRGTSCCKLLSHFP